MQQGMVKRVGNKTVDVQLSGSTMPTTMRVSGQISWDQLAPGTQVLVEIFGDEPIVLHTIATAPIYTSPQPNNYTRTINNALLSDGSVALVGNLPVAPGKTIDGVDVSELAWIAQTLNQATTIGRGGFTMFTHATSLVYPLVTGATTLTVGEPLFENNEHLILISPTGATEVYKVDGIATQHVDGKSWTYTIEKVSSGAMTWPAGSLVHGTTRQAYISVDSRSNSRHSPSLRFISFTKDDPVWEVDREHIVRLGRLTGIQGKDEESLGFAFGRLTTGDQYLLYDYLLRELVLKNADIIGLDQGNRQVVRIYAKGDEEHVAGDFIFGPLDGTSLRWSVENEQLCIYYQDTPILCFGVDDGDGHPVNQLATLISAGSRLGPKVSIGELDDEAIIVLRNRYDVPVFLVTSTEQDAIVHIGRPKPHPGWLEYENGVLQIDGAILARSYLVVGDEIVNLEEAFAVRLPEATRAGQVLMSADGSTFSACTPLIGEAGWLFDECTSTLLAADVR